MRTLTQSSTEPGMTIEQWRTIRGIACAAWATVAQCRSTVPRRQGSRTKSCPYSQHTLETKRGPRLTRSANL
eukprot:5148524-Alexandrium_andersonii.AAC.1